MKNILVLVLALCSTLCIHIEDAAGAATTTTTSAGKTDHHFTAVCEATDKATITVNKDYVAGPHSKCFPTPTNKTATTGGHEYSLDSNCVGTGAFIIEPDVGDGLLVGNNSQLYSLACSGNGEGELVTIDLSLSLVTEPTVNPITEKGRVSHPPIPSYTMALITKTTDITFTDLTTTGITNVYLGEKIKLAIYPQDRQAGTLFIIPQSCEASSGSHKLTLWKLYKDSKLCVKEEAVMTSNFKAENTSDGVQFVDASMEAFEFQEELTYSVTFSCSVRVCTSLPANSTCEKEHTDMSCIPTTTPSPTSTTASPMGRRRRDTQEDDSPVGRGSLHHVTATLHIRDDVMAMGGCSRVLYTVSCLVLSVLAAVIM